MGKSIKLSMHTMMLGIIALCVILTVTYEGTGLSSLPIASVAIYICFAVGLLYTFLNRTIKLHWSYYALLFFGICLSVSMLYSPTSKEIQGIYIYRFWTSAIFFFLVCNVVRARRDINVLLMSIVVSGVVLSITVYAEYGISNLFALEGRLIFGDINMLAGYCAFSIVTAFAYCISYQEKRILAIIAIVTCIPMVMFSGSRKAVILITVGIITFLFMYGNNKALLKKIFIAAILIGLLIILIERVPAFNGIRVHFEEMFNLFSGGDDLNVGDQNRINFIEDGLVAFLESPICGKGFVSSYYYLGAYTHCNFVELLMNNGILGFASYYFIRLKIIKDCAKIKVKDNFYFILCLTFSAMMLFSDIGVVTFYNRYYMVITAICIKILDVERNNK